MGTIRALIIDHYDSYTNNILQLLQGTQQRVDGKSYPEWNVAIVRFDQFSWDYFSSEILPHLDAIILSPGPGTPHREADFGFNSRLIREANIPILGICLGHQGIGTTFGANIIHTPNIKHGQICQIHHKDNGILRGLPQRFDGVRYNSLVLDIEDVPSELQVTAWTYDPENPSKKVLMGLQHRQRPIFGTQWHPESICSAHGKQIISNFRDIVIDFWSTSNPRNQWTRRWIGDNASLPDHILEQNVVIEQTPTENTFSPPKGSAYYIKSAPVGRGPPPQVVFQTLCRGRSPDGEAWLDSAKVRDSHSRNSYLSSASFTLSYSTKSKCVSFFQNGKKTKSQRLDVTYWAWLDRFQQETILGNTEALDAEVLNQETDPGQPLLQVGLVGYFGYELKRESLPGYRFTPPDEQDVSFKHSDSELLFANTVLRLDNYTGEWTIFSLIRRGEEDPIGDAISASTKIGIDETQFASNLAQVREIFDAPPSPPYIQAHPLPEFVALDNEGSYSRTIQAAQDFIREGESYELTLTTKFKAKSPEVDSYSLYLDLRERNPAPYSAFIHFAAHDKTILSSSPERFISVDSDRVAEMKPIKGTLAVHPDPIEDERRKHQLATDVKELAENLMIVDLIRSDLHNISPSTSISVPKLLHVETYQTVHQLVTTIQSKIASSVGGVQVIERCFPPGSMTGAPKLRSVQILDSLENQRERGIYSGSIGYICASGAVDQSVVIRTIVRSGNDLELGAGGAITWLSEADKEWDEVMVKANAVARGKGRTIVPEATLGSLEAFTESKGHLQPLLGVN
ncbi:para-aminobenzoate synthase [Fusarium beomiforme]|uniref:aminodeoxychorismate synthase n=1 Tax=Fusarium beomiforme TaxID=44412 RepID=A0A9P5A812_9HYPO|nr:para-aminobenzoate synthase [Fusarium beomiforme]